MKVLVVDREEEVGWFAFWFVKGSNKSKRGKGLRIVFWVLRIIRENAGLVGYM